jgi:ATP-dependent DNA helicase RecQ
VKFSERIQKVVDGFLEKEFLPRIEKRGTVKNPAHEAGWSLSYHGSSPIGTMIRLSKYEGAGPFSKELVSLTVELIRTRYPVETIDGVVSVPPTRSGTLVEMFARDVANMLGIRYVSVLVKVRSTGEQKKFTNRLQKADNVKGAFEVPVPKYIAGRTLLLIDDIYDSGQTMREVGQTLMKAGAKAVYPLTITRTVHSDDQ